MLPGKGKQAVKRSGKGSKDAGGKVMPSSSKSKDSPPVKIKIEPEEIREPAVLPIVRIIENNRTLPRYTSVLARGKDDTIGVEDLDALQLELENLLSTAALRHRALTDEISQVESLDERHKKKLTGQKPGMNSSPSSLKRTATRAEVRPTKKIKTEGTRADLPSGKLNKLRAPAGYEPQDSQSPKPETQEIPKNEVPDKFWASVEPFCRAITTEDINYLKDLIRTREEERCSDLYTIPPLGKHYTIRWAEEDGVEQPKKTSSLGGTAGPMTQRLVAALVEDRSNSFSGVDSDRSRELSAPRAASLSHVKSLSFENRVREELREQGILDGDEAPKEQADDELLLEMKRCQSELKALAAHNLQRLRHLLALAEAQMERQEKKKTVQNINAEILKMHAVKLEKKVLSRKERETTWRLIKDLKSVLKELYPNMSKN